MPAMMLALAKLPTWVKVGAGMGLLIGLLQLHHWWNTRDLKRDLAKQQELLKQTQEEAAKVAVNLQQETSNRMELEAANARQNARINDIAARARQAEAAAALATLRQLKEGNDAADALRDESTTVPVGETAMNQWLRNRFGVTP